MMTQTPDPLKLNKYESSDAVKPDGMNANFDTINSYATTNNTKVNALESLAKTAIGIPNTNPQRYLSFKVMTRSEYNAATKDSNTLYFIKESET